MALTAMLIPLLDILAQVSFIESIRSGVHLISGTLALLVILLSVLMQLASFGFGVELVGSMFWTGLVLIAIDLALQAVLNWFIGTQTSLEGAVRDFVILLIGAGVGYAIKHDLLGYFVGLGILGFTILVWGLPGVVERCAGHCFFVKYL